MHILKGAFLMAITDWEKWMKERHVKLRGKDNDSKGNEKCIGPGIFRANMENESKQNGRPASSRNL